MYTLLKPLIVREELLKRGLHVFTPLEFTRLFQTKPHQTKYFLEKESKGGLFLRLKNGVYSLKTDLPGEEEIANRLYAPSYISFEYALATYNILPEAPYQITSATTKPTRIFTINGQTFTYFTIKKDAYTGYVLTKKNGRRFLIAEPEKALVDYLYFVVLRKRPPNDRLRISSLNKKKVLLYGQLYNRQNLLTFIRRLLY